MEEPAYQRGYSRCRVLLLMAFEEPFLALDLGGLYRLLSID